MQEKSAYFAVTAAPLAVTIIFQKINILIRFGDSDSNFLNLIVENGSEADETGLQHVKRKFLDCGDDEEAQAIVRLVNELYRMEHRHKIETDGWTAGKNLRWRKKYAPAF